MITTHTDNVLLSLDIKQLTDNARKWSHERADLLLRLQETEYGLTRSSPPPPPPVERYVPYLGYTAVPLIDNDFTPRDFSTSRDVTQNGRRGVVAPIGGQRTQRLPNINPTLY